MGLCFSDREKCYNNRVNSPNLSLQMFCLERPTLYGGIIRDGTAVEFDSLTLLEYLCAT